MLELDHIFVFTKPKAKELLATLESHGFDMGRGRIHEGQGTENQCLFFDHAYFEAIWERDKEETQLEKPKRANMPERAHWRDTGFSPFGVALRFINNDPWDKPFKTWKYNPGFMPKGSFIDVAESNNKTSPFFFIMHDVTRPDQRPEDHPMPVKQFLNHSNGVNQIREVRITVPLGEALSEPCQAIEQVGIIEVVRGKEHLMELYFSDLPTKTIDFRPTDPLVMYI
jgi:hypothetical protein